MTLPEMNLLAEKLLDSTHDLVVGPNTNKSKLLFPRVVEGTFRRDYLTLYTMLYLAHHEMPEARAAFGTSCMDLARRVQEDLISLEYILHKGKEEYSKKFMDFEAVEAKRDIDYLETAGMAIKPSLKKSIEDNYERVKNEFIDASGKTRRKAWTELTDYLKSLGKIDEQLEKNIDAEFNKRYPNINQEPRRAWAGLDVEGMIDELVKDKIIDIDEQRVLKQTYVKGNTKNHFSPTDIRVFLSDKAYTMTNEADLLLGLVTTTIGVTRMARMFADEFDIPAATKQEIDDLWQVLLTAHLPKDKKA